MAGRGRGRGAAAAGPTVEEQLAEAQRELAELRAATSGLSAEAEADLAELTEPPEEEGDEDRVYVVPGDYPEHPHARDFPIATTEPEGLPTVLQLRDDEVAEAYRSRQARQAVYLYRRRVSAWAYTELAIYALQEVVSEEGVAQGCAEDLVEHWDDLDSPDEAKADAARASIAAAVARYRADKDVEEHSRVRTRRALGTLRGANELLQTANEVEYISKAPAHTVHPEVSKGIVNQAITFDGYVPRSRALQAVYKRFEKRVGTKLGDSAATTVAAQPPK